MNITKEEILNNQDLKEIYDNNLLFRNIIYKLNKKDSEINIIKEIAKVCDMAEVAIEKLLNKEF
jgi:hypothetical protein